MALHASTTGPPIRALTMEPEVLRQFIKATFPTSGIVTPGTSGTTGDMNVQAHGTPNMSVDVQAGFCVIPGADVALTQGSYIAYNDATANLVVSASDPTNPRIDRVICCIQDAFYQGAVNAPSFQVIAGTPAGSPVVPAVPAAYRDFIDLAQVAVAANASSIIAGNITDTRINALGRASGITDPSWITVLGGVGFQNGWVNMGGAYFDPAYRRVGGRVYLRGLAKSGTVFSVIFTLPAGYRPSAQGYYVGVSNSAFGAVTIDNGGVVTQQVGTNAFMSLDNIEFDVL